MKRLCYPICFLLVLTQCANENQTPPVSSFPDGYQPLIDTFIEEARIRGVSISLDNVVLTESTLADTQCGNCNSQSLDKAIQKIIKINADHCWENQYQQEALVFHELGHCVLGREHDERLLPNGDKKSLMTAGNISLYAPCVYDVSNDTSCDKTSRRDYYLDELFHPETPVPDWAH